MENYIVSARKYRPNTFDTVIGQHTITVTLKNAIKIQHLAHAYLFCGPRGVGKTTCARIFAKTINCYNPTEEMEACDVCESCMSFNQNRSYNIHELDAASNNSVDDIKLVIDKVRIPPQIGKYSVYIIDEVHMLSSSAFNAFLKTLEEPPAYAIFILATTEKHKIIPTILSRCQIFDFNRIRIEDMVHHLAYVAEKEGINADSDALNIIAQKSDGAMRDALSFFDQIVSFAGSAFTYDDALAHLNVLDYDYFFRLTEYFLTGNISEVLLTYDTILSKGFDGHHFISGMASHLRDVLVSRDNATLKLLEVGDNIRERYKSQAALCSPDFIFKALNVCSNCDVGYKSSKNQRLHVEMALIQLCHITRVPELIENKIPSEKKSVEEPVKPVTPPTTPPKILTEAKPKSVSAQKEVTKPADTNLLTASISIKNINKKVVADEVKIETEKETILNETFTQEQLQQAWNIFAEKIKADKPRFYSTMTSLNPVLTENNIIEICFENASLKTALKEIQTELLNYLKTELKNSHIQIKTSVVEKDNTQTKKIYTDADKFNFLNEKNPNLSILQKKMNLDFQ
ncbi:MAG: DNA polymerase III, subunit gamma and tau [Bacteroidetes bacterium RIFOXYA12_FULL_35_11]|nr:MAG: DNA polymerase III, subunit gamma and tau [Bacteroidetes bacterium GWF2_35_48]OFY73126.1 MAG: DNA polymerase III, subunit gamma and tau [Bacteroidetes bacterium RIFOXYA12_FULL_35_11]HBX51572.1 DNA polymerase III subunit gamma/tau [Bacteroidales bacterium]